MRCSFGIDFIIFEQVIKLIKLPRDKVLRDDTNAPTNEALSLIRLATFLRLKGGNK